MVFVSIFRQKRATAHNLSEYHIAKKPTEYLGKRYLTDITFILLINNPDERCPIPLFFG